MANVRTAVKYSVVTQYVFRVLSLVNVILIARLLTPEELGVFAIVAAIIMIAGQLKSFGASQYIIKQEDLDEVKVKTSLGLSSLVSWPLGVLLIVGSYPLAQFYEQPDLALMLCIASTSFFTAPHSGMGRALLERDFEFKTRFYVSTTVQVFNVSLCLSLILLDFSYFSMPIASAFSVILEASLFYITRKPLYQVFPQYKGIQEVAKFGVYVSLASLLRNTNNVLPDLIIGKMGTPADVAFFSRGLGFLDFLSNTVVSGIRPVALPYISQQKRLNNNIQEAYYKATELIGALIIPVMAVAGVASYPVIDAFFGDQWEDSAQLVQILCFWGMLKAMNIMTLPLAISLNGEKYLFYLQMVITAISIGLIIYTYPYGLNAVAAAMVISATVEALGYGIIAKKVADIPVLGFFTVNWRNFVIAAVCALVVVGMDQIIGFDSHNSILVVVLIGSIIGPLWLALLFLMKHSLSEEIQQMVLPLLRQFKKG